MPAPPSPPRTAFVTGGSGFVGGRLIETLVREGWAVRALARSPGAASAVAGRGATPVPGDLAEAGGDLPRALEGVDIVFHAAAMFRFWGARADFDRVNREGTRRLLAAAVAAGTVRRLVKVGAAAVVMGAPGPMHRATEALPLREPGFAPYAASKAAAERLVLAADASAAGGLATVVVRPPFIWGAGMPSLDHMVGMVRAGRFVWVGGGAHPVATAHVDNVCHALRLAAVAPGIGGQAFFIDDGEDRPLRAVISALLATRGVVPPDRSVPFPLAWGLAGAMGAAWKTLGLAGEPPITRQMLRLIGQPFTLDTARARQALGYAPVVGWAEGLAAMRAAEAALPRAA